MLKRNQEEETRKKL